MAAEDDGVVLRQEALHLRQQRVRPPGEAAVHHRPAPPAGPRRGPDVHVVDEEVPHRPRPGEGDDRRVHTVGRQADELGLQVEQDAGDAVCGGGAHRPIFSSPRADNLLTPPYLDLDMDLLTTVL